MKKAFSIAETLFVFIFIGIVSIIGLHTINNRAMDYFARYNVALDSLSKAAYNTYTDTYCKDDCTAAEKRNGRPFPDKPRNLCLRLKEYLNDSDQSNTCKDAVIPDAAKSSNFSDATLQFKATNGFRFYFSDLKTIRMNDSTMANNHSSQNKQVQYFIVYVDLNGDKKPNIISYNDANKPDIVPFAVTRTGDVIPMGHPTVDKTYITARVLNTANIIDPAKDKNQTSSMTYKEAVETALGCSQYFDIPQTIHFSEKMNDNNEAKPDAYKGAVNNKCSKDLMKNYKNSQGETYCEEGSFSCVVKIDESIDKRH